MLAKEKYFSRGGQLVLYLYKLPVAEAWPRTETFFDAAEEKYSVPSRGLAAAQF